MFYIVLGALTFERNIFWRLCTGRRRRDEEEEEEEEEAIAFIGGRCWLMRDVVCFVFFGMLRCGAAQREIIGTEN
jgi:hypothetical protein